MRIAPSLLLASGLFVAANAASSVPAANPSPTAGVYLPVTGVHLDPLEAPKGDALGQVVMMSLPPTEGFAPSVNIIIQAYPLGIKSYIDLSKKQFDQVGAKVLSEKTPNASEWDIEYAGDIQGHSCHFYAKAFSIDNKIYLATGTTLASQWAQVGEKIKKCVDSFRMDAPPPAPVAAPATTSAH